MHHRGSEAIKKAINKLLDDLEEQLANCKDQVLKQVRNETAVFFEHNSSDGLRTTSRRVISQPKIKLQKSLQADLDTLTLTWKEDVAFEPQEPDIGGAPDFDGEDDDFSLFADGKDDGDYVFGESDAED